MVACDALPIDICTPINFSRLNPAQGEMAPRGKEGERVRTDVSAPVMQQFHSVTFSLTCRACTCARRLC